MKLSKVFRVAGLVAIVVAILAAIITSMNHKTPNSEKVWDTDMTMGSLDAENYYIIYSDLACPYCVAFENALIENEEEFKQYIEENDILVEVRLSDFLYEYGQSQSPESRYGAEAIYCAKKEGKFWEYYNLAITKVWDDYFAEMGKAAFTEFNKLGKDYWVKMGKEVGLGSSFKDCVENDETLDEVKASALKSVKLIDGMPYFKFNKYISSGFDLSWGWEYAKMYLESGLKPENKL
ncbi:thioredoxin domain-containing protein [Candidatus Saccharibacteria bacterium]|nr:thioredoxin domain-containing protein [Candidatus Saccharibacteria bacterium]